MLTPDELNRICRRIQEFQVHRKHAIKLENKCMNAIIAMAARYCGYDANAEESARKKLFGRAERIVSRGLKGKPQDEADLDVAKEIQGELEMIALMLPPLVSHRARIEGEMDALAEELPGGELIAATPGFSRHGLAIIVGEAGNLLNYPKKGHLWRRLGLGLMPGKGQHAFSTWRMKGGLNSEEWETAGYSPQRLAQVYGVVTEQLIKFKAKSKYGEVYARRRARTLITHPEWYLDKDGNQKISKDTGEPSSAHAAKDAARVMVKALLRDLWSEWRRARVNMAEKPKNYLPAASSFPTEAKPALFERTMSGMPLSRRRTSLGLTEKSNADMSAAPLQQTDFIMTEKSKNGLSTERRAESRVIEKSTPVMPAASVAE
jgi:hypothetical protein